MKTHDLGRAYVSRMNFPALTELPLVCRGWTAETDEPYRIGTCLIFRIPRTRVGVALGWWGPPKSEIESLTLATGMRRLTDEEVDDVGILA